ncbi:EVE domain-containing protein [Candidatus Nitrospira salsa]
MIRRIVRVDQSLVDAELDELVEYPYHIGLIILIVFTAMDILYLARYIDAFRANTSNPHRTKTPSLMSQYWLLKSEPRTFSVDDLASSPRQTTCWEGVRNYQARNFLCAMKRGEQALFYHSNADPPAIAGLVEIVKESYPDHYAFDSKSRYYDAKSTPDASRWFMVDVKFVKKFSSELPLSFLRDVPELRQMELLRKGSRLSVQPVRALEWKAILRLAGNTL